MLLMKMMMMLSNEETFPRWNGLKSFLVFFLFGTFTRAKKARIIRSDERDFNRVTTMRRER